MIEALYPSISTFSLDGYRANRDHAWLAVEPVARSSMVGALIDLSHSTVSLMLGPTRTDKLPPNSDTTNLTL